MQQDIYQRFKPVDLIWGGHEDATRNHINIWFRCVRPYQVSKAPSHFCGIELIDASLVYLIGVTSALLSLFCGSGPNR